MLMMQINQMSLILLISFLCFRQVIFVQPQLDQNEVDVLRKIATTLKITNPTNDPCISRTLSVNASISTEQSITCDYRDGFLHVTILKLKSMSLEGTLPPELVNLKFLEEIDLSRNYLSGGLPKEWATMRHLNRINLLANRLSGKIPKEWGNFANLTDFNCLIIGSNFNKRYITRVVHNYRSLSSNQFVGSLPITLEKLTNLTDFRISDNSFNGTVPEFIGSWTKLKRLEMSSSGLEGPISPTIFALGDLTDLRITDMIGPKFDFPKLNSKKMEHLVLRNLNMSGFIPTYIWDMGVGETLDLTFNKLEGGIENINTETDFIFLSGNMLSGTIPESIIYSTKKNLSKFGTSMFLSNDLSYNNFTSPVNCPTRSGLRPGPCPDRSGCQKYYQSFHINCGGPDVTINHTKYEGDGGANGAVLQYDSGTKWGLISAGDFMGDSNKNANGYIVSAQPDTQPKLYSEARASPLFLTYYGYCLENGNYTVNLHFAEILFTDKEPYHKVGRRIFDIYIQGILKWKDFNIKEQANGTSKAIIKTFNTTVTENTLEIRLYWAGKGTTCIPRRGYYGPLISAISVCRGFRANCDAAAQWQRLSSVIAGVTVGTFALVVLVVGFCILCLRKKRNTDGEDDCLIDLVDKDSEDMQLHGEEVVQMMRVAVWCLQNDYNRRPSMSTVVKVLEGTMEFEASLTAITREPEEQSGGATTSVLLTSILSGPSNHDQHLGLSINGCNKERNRGLRANCEGEKYIIELCYDDLLFCYALFSPLRFSSVGDTILGTKAEEEAFNLQQKGNLMEIVEPMLEDKFDMEEAEKMIRVAVPCFNADPTLRPTMSEVYAEILFVSKPKDNQYTYSAAQQIWEAVCANDKKALYCHIVNSEADVNAVHEQVACNSSLTLAKAMLLNEQTSLES
ncbi:hypothetical protein EZV62_027009 [Acer yangbiense]|uniref:non-specific serine/threonine protein kinase n=1 Tax=Acer yangbiense TaxID=1000413 RepID=A0A5C7GT02_9ROSI|nr:hypothetical protein EZV62_027009 [Acer yangbiense]